MQRNLMAALAAALLVAGCGTADHTAKATRPPRAARPRPAEPIDLDKLRPNELGKVLILEYHDVGDTEERWKRQRDNFRADLQRLYDLGYRPVSLRHYVTNNIETPAGKSPIVITFDDSTAGQFNYLYADDAWKVDPDCAVAIMEDFHRKHPDWPLEATFYVYYPVPFRQEDLIGKKLRYLVDVGMDIGNHTYTHARLDKISDQDAAQEIALGVKAAGLHAPDAVVDSIALPYGKAPKNKSILVSGRHEGTKYHNIAALLVGAEPAPSPVAHKFDPYRLPRVQATQSELDKWLRYFERRPDKRYVSDGDPDIVTVPKDMAQHIDKTQLSTSKTLRTY